MIGLICGNLSLFSLCLFGFRDFINIWFGFEFLSYFLGIYLIFIIVYEMSTYPIRTILQLRKRQFWKVIILNFLLVWTDQPSVYQFTRNLSFSTGVTLLDFSTNTSIIFYLLGITIGSIFWTYLIQYGVSNLNFFVKFVMKFLPYEYTYVHWIKGFNRFCLIGCVALTLTNVPLYGLDYLFTNPLGFIPYDSAWETTPFFSKLKANASDTNNRGRLGEKSSYYSVDTDFSLFTEGHYGGAAPIEFHFESLNYRREYAWRSRFDRISSRNFVKTGGLLNKYLNEQLGPLEEARKIQKKQDKKTQKMLRVKKVKKLEKQRNFQVEEEPNFYVLSEHKSEEKLGFMESNEFLIERFIENYVSEATKNDEELPDLPDEKMVYFSAFSEIAKYGFDLFSLFENADADPVDEEIAIDLKQKYFDNFVYKFFLNLDIRSFLRRQPYQLSAKDEVNLFKIRLALGEYYNAVRYSLRLPNFKLFSGPRSYCNRIYNQQFKGTLKIVEHLFSINLEKEENIPILEIEKDKEKEPDFFLKDPSTLKFDQPLYKKKEFINPLLHEELMENFKFSLKKIYFLPSIREEKLFPLFVGWDNEKRLFVLTNRFLADDQMLTNITLPKPKENFKKFLVQLKQLVKINKAENDTENKAENDNDIDFTFTTWPVSNKDEFYTNLVLKRLYRNQGDLDFFNLEGEDLFKYLEPLTDEETIIYETLPSIVERVDLKNTEKINTSLSPSRGGFVWPGNFPLKFKIKEQFVNPLLKQLGL